MTTDLKNNFFWYYHRFYYHVIRNISTKKEIRFVGMKRSGNHAILNWIVRQTPGLVCYYNDVDINASPLNKMIESHYKNLWLNIPAGSQVRRKPCVISSFEDCKPEDVFGESNLFNLQHHFRKNNELYEVLIIRDPFNLFASRFFHRSHRKSFIANPKILYDLVDLWKLYAYEYLHKTNYLKNNKIVINYNLWVKDKNYRQKLAKNLNLVFTDQGFEEVAVHGQGSSFSKTQIKDASYLKVFERWRELENDPLYCSIFNDSEVIALSQQIFGEIPETELLYKK
jgi:hypothetical protein